MMFKSVSKGKLDIQTYNDWSDFKKLLKMGYDEVDVNVFCHRHKLAANVIPLLEQALIDILAMPNVLLGANVGDTNSYVSKAILDSNTLSKSEVDNIKSHFRTTDRFNNKAVHILNIQLTAAPTLGAILLNIYGFSYYEDEKYGEALLKKLNRILTIDEILNTL